MICSLVRSILELKKKGLHPGLAWKHSLLDKMVKKNEFQKTSKNGQKMAKKWPKMTKSSKIETKNYEFKQKRDEK